MKYLPTIPQVTSEGIKILGGILLAAFILSRFPQLRGWVQNNSLTISDQSKNVLYF